MSTHVNKPIPLARFLCGSLLCYLVFLAGPGYGQSHLIYPVRPPEGINWVRLTTITQDREGQIWLGGMGLFCYDGYRFKAYRHDPIHPNSLGGDKAEVVYCDRQGYVWIGLMGEGLDRLNPATGQFTHYRHDPRRTSSLSHDEVTTILEDKEGTLWIGTHGGLNRLDRRTGRFTRYQHDPAKPTSLSNDQVRVLYEDKGGKLWVGTGSEWGQSSKDAGGLNRFDATTQSFTRYLHQPNDLHSLTDNKVRSIYEDQQGTFWVGTYGDGLHTLDRQRGRFTRYPYDEQHPWHLSRPYLQNRAAREPDGISFINGDAKGGVWIGTYKNGLNRYDPLRRTLQHWEAQPGQANALQENGPWAFFTSREGVHWVSTFDGGLYRLVPTQPVIPFTSLGTTVHAFLEDRSGRRWIGTATGLLCQYQGKTRWFRHEPTNPASLPSDDIREIYQDRQGLIWVGTKGGGLCRYDMITRRFYQYPHSAKGNRSLITDNVHVIRQDRFGKLWLGTTKGLDEFDPLTGHFTHYQHNPLDSATLSDDGIPILLEAREGTLWAGGYFKGGVNRYHRASGSFRRYLPGLRVTGLIEDNQGVIWVSGVGGLFRYDRKFDRFRPAFLNPHSNPRDITSVQLDNNNNLWISDLVGILKVDSARRTTTRYGRLQGVNGRTMWEFSGYKAPDNRLFFGDRMGYYAFYPARVTTRVQPAQVVLTDIRVNGQVRVPTSLAADIPGAPPRRQLELTHEQNTLTFGFAYMDYRSPELNQHQFKLANYESDWHVAGPERAASYMQVPPGAYEFIVRGASAEGLWVEQRLRVLIHPPWWQTTWFRLSASIMVFLLIGLSIRSYTQIRLRGQRTNLQRVLQVQEEERQRLAADLHDDLGATLSAIKGQLETLPSSTQGLGMPIRLMEKAIYDLRLISHNLMPPDFSRLGLTEILREAIGQRQVGSAPNLLFVTFGEQRRINLESELIIYRIAVELINNTLKHARAGHVTVQLIFYPEQVCLLVEDDGMGYSTALRSSAGAGLRNIRSRATYLKGDLVIDSNQKGTTVTLTVPY